MNVLRPLLTAILAALPMFAFAEAQPPADESAKLAEYRKLAEGIKYQTGTIMLRDGLAKVALPGDFRYLNGTDTTTVLNKLWGNPGGNDTLGMIVPADFDPLASGSWAVVLTYDEDGYVKDDDAAKIDYAELLEKMKASAKNANEERQKAGYPAIELIGWAATPKYDPAAHKLYWAKELKFGSETEHTLNYNIRMLGRRGVLVMNVVASMGQLKQVEAATPNLLAMVDFQEGHRYADYNGDTDKVATYGLAALVAGGVAAKSGILKMLWVGILAFKKVIIMALVAGAASIGKLWAWIRGRQAPQEAAAATAGEPPSQT